MDGRNRTKTSPSSLMKRRRKSAEPIATARAGASPGVDFVTALRKVGGLGTKEDRIDSAYLEIGERIRVARIDRGWTQSQLAKRARCSQSDISDLERGRTGPNGPSLRTLQNISDALGIELVVSASPPLHIEADTEGEVRRTVTDYCTVNALLTSDELASIRGYVLNTIRESTHAKAWIRDCTLLTLGTNASVQCLRSETPTMVRIVRGRGHFVRHSITGQIVEHPKEAGVLTILGSGDWLDIQTRGSTGLTMMIVPVHNITDREDEFLGRCA